MIAVSLEMSDEPKIFGQYEWNFGNSIPLLLSADWLGVLRFRSYNITWWFNQLIIICYLLFPLFFHVIKVWWKSTIIVALMLLVFNPWESFSSYFAYSFAFLIGILFGEKRLEITKWYENHGHSFNLLVLFCVMLPLLAVVRTFSVIPKLNGLKIDPFLTLDIVGLIVYTLRKTTWLSMLVCYLGKHSMNIYMIHTFFFYYFFHDIIYWFKYPPLIFFALLACSLVTSIVIEFVKRHLGLYKIQNNLIQNIKFK